MSLARLMPIYLVVFVGFVGYALMVSLFVPMIMGDHGFVAAGAGVGSRTIIAGALLACYPLGQFLGAPILGTLSDRFGRKPVIVASLIVTTACYVAIGLALEVKALPLLAIACFVCGLSESNIAIAQSVIADVAGPDDRGRLFGYVYAASSLGYVLSPMAGGALAVAYGYALPFWIVLALMVGLTLWVTSSFTESLPPERRVVRGYLQAFAGLVTVFTDVALRRLYLVNFLLYLAIFGYFRSVLMYMVDRWQMPVHWVTIFYTYLSVAAGIATLFCMPILSRRVDMKTLTLLAAAIGGVICIAHVLPDAESSLWFTTGPTSFAAAIALSACAALLSGATSEERQGSVLGNNQALQVGAEALSAAAGGMLAAIVIPLPLIVFGSVMILAAAILLGYRPAPAAMRAATATAPTPAIRHLPPTRHRPAVPTGRLAARDSA